MFNNNLKGIAMSTKELKDIVVFFKSKGVSPTIKELCSGSYSNLYIDKYIKNKAVVN